MAVTLLFTTIGILFSSLSYDFGDSHILVADWGFDLHEINSCGSHVNFDFGLFIINCPDF